MPDEPEQLLKPGATIGRYEITRAIGAGGMGAVFEATHSDLKKRVAIKVLLPEMASNPELRTRFIREGEASARIRHPHVVDVYDVGYQDGIAFLVMEYLEGGDLSALLKKSGPLGEEAIANIMLPVCAAIAAAHREQVIHRDLKPANIFLCDERRTEPVPKVLDFGISKIVREDRGEALTSSGAILGTPHYMSPEQARGRPANAQSDQYALGVIMYQCSTGQRPFGGDSMYEILHAIVVGAATPPTAMGAKISPAFEAVIARAMAGDPEARFSSVTELGAAVLPFAGEKARLVWADAFGSVPVSAAPAPIEAAAPAPLADPAPDEATQHGASVSRPLKARSRLPVLLVGAASAAIAIAILALLGGEREKVISIPVAAPEASRRAALEPPASAKDAPPASAPPSQPPTFAVRTQVDPPQAIVELDGTPTQAPLDLRLPIDGVRHTLMVRAAGFEPKSLQFQDAPPPERISLSPLPKAPAKAEARPKPKPVEAVPPGVAPKRGANDAPILR